MGVSMADATADSGMRNERPQRIAGRSPACTMRYTVIEETRIMSATSATVRKRTSLRSRSMSSSSGRAHTRGVTNVSEVQSRGTCD